MTRRISTHLALVALIFVSGVALVACEENPVGRICDLGIEAPSENESVVASPSLDCPTRRCLKVPLQNDCNLPDCDYPEGNRGLCTAECEVDSDCDRVPESPCETGFTCAIPVVVGPFCCQKMCICKDYVVVPEGGIATPAACDESDPANTCCNLPGRAGNPEYPACP